MKFNQPPGQVERCVGFSSASMPASPANHRRAAEPVRRCVGERARSASSQRCGEQPGFGESIASRNYARSIGALVPSHGFRHG
jgi:hypothetical protein